MLDFLLAHRLWPDFLLRRRIRRRLEKRLHTETEPTEVEHRTRLERFAAELRTLLIDPAPPPEEETLAFHRLCLGPRLKQSCCWFERGSEDLPAAEEAMLRLYGVRARLDDGQSILDLGAGWGSLSLWSATRYPNATITAVCRSRPQKDFIEAEATRLGLQNVIAVAADLNDFETSAGSFDRVISIELFEQLKNWPRLLAGVARWLKPEGLAFLQIFTHQRLAYHLAPIGTADWLGRRFHPGAMMPSDDLLSHFQDDLRIIQHWRVDGRHYQHTADLWLRNLDTNRDAARAQLVAAHGADRAIGRLVDWRIFFLTCAERWGYRQGAEWLVSHYLLQKATTPRGHRSPPG